MPALPAVGPAQPPARAAAQPEAGPTQPAAWAATQPEAGSADGSEAQLAAGPAAGSEAGSEAGDLVRPSMALVTPPSPVADVEQLSLL